MTATVASNFNSLIPYIALFVSMASFWNAYMARKEGKRLRQQALYQSEFDRQIRTPIEAALGQLYSTQKTLDLIPLSSKIRAISTIREDATQHVRDVDTAVQTLLNTLEYADTTTFADGADWLSAVEPLHDDLLQTNDEIQQATSHEAIMTANGRASSALGRIIASVRARIDRQLIEHIGRQ